MSNRHDSYTPPSFIPTFLRDPTGDDSLLRDQTFPLKLPPLPPSTSKEDWWAPLSLPCNSPQSVDSLGKRGEMEAEQVKTPVAAYASVVPKGEEEEGGAREREASRREEGAKGLYVVTGGGESASRGLPYVREPSPTTAELFSFVESASDQELRSWKASPKGSLSEEEEGTDAFPQLQGTDRDYGHLTFAPFWQWSIPPPSPFRQHFSLLPASGSSTWLSTWSSPSSPLSQDLASSSSQSVDLCLSHHSPSPSQTSCTHSPFGSDMSFASSSGSSFEGSSPTSPLPRKKVRAVPSPSTSSTSSRTVDDAPSLSPSSPFFGSFQSAAPIYDSHGVALAFSPTLAAQGFYYTSSWKAYTQQNCTFVFSISLPTTSCFLGLGATRSIRGMRATVTGSSSTAGSAIVLAKVPPGRNRRVDDYKQLEPLEIDLAPSSARPELVEVLAQFDHIRIRGAMQEVVLTVVLEAVDKRGEGVEVGKWRSGMVSVLSGAKGKDPPEGKAKLARATREYKAKKKDGGRRSADGEQGEGGVEEEE